MKLMKLSMILIGILALLLLAAQAAVPSIADSGKPTIAVTSVQVAPATFMPGDSGTITATITCTARTTAQNTDTQTTSGTYNFFDATNAARQTPGITQVSSDQDTSVNFSSGAVTLTSVSLQGAGPIGVTSDPYMNYGRLSPGDTAKFTFTVKANSQATDGFYNLTLNVDTDDGGVYVSYPIMVQVESEAPQITVSSYAKEYNGTDDSMSIDVFNPRDTPITAVSVQASGDEFVIAPQTSFVGTLAPGATYTSDFTVDSKNFTFNTMPQFVLVYKNGDNWHQSAPISVPDHPPLKTDWDIWWQGLTSNLTSYSLWAAWWTYIVAAIIIILLVIIIVPPVIRRMRETKEKPGK